MLTTKPTCATMHVTAIMRPTNEESTMAAKARKSIQLGTNVQSHQDGDILWVGIDLGIEGEQTKGSRENPDKPAREMVGTTSSFTAVPGTDCSLLLHLTRPMEVKKAIQNTRTKRALAELDEEDEVATLGKLANIDPEKLAKLLSMLE